MFVSGTTLLKSFGPARKIPTAPIGAVMSIESTAIVNICDANFSTLSSALFFLAKSSATGPRAACKSIKQSIYLSFKKFKLHKLISNMYLIYNIIVLKILRLFIHKSKLYSGGNKM